MPPVTIVLVAAPPSEFLVEASPFRGEYFCGITVIVGPTGRSNFSLESVVRRATWSVDPNPRRIGM
jgi:hypothetical protein